MTRATPKWPRLELVLFILAAAGAALAWSTRARRTAGEAPAAHGDSAATPAAPKRRDTSRARHESPLSPEATLRAREMCAMMVRAQVGFALKEDLTTEVTDAYGVGDRETGAGDSLIVEGLARMPSGRVSEFRCSMANLGAYAGSPYITHRER